MATQLIQDKQKSVFKDLGKDYGWTSTMQTPKVVKVVVSSGVGKFMKDKEKVKLVGDRLGRITGQKPADRTAKKSIATYKTRIGDKIGYQVTLRGKRAEDFLNRLIHVALPRTKDFKGISTAALDEMGNYTLGIKEHSVFPETADEDIKDVFGIGVTVVTTAKDKASAQAYLSHLGFPFKK